MSVTELELWSYTFRDATLPELAAAAGGGRVRRGDAHPGAVRAQRWTCGRPARPRRRPRRARDLRRRPVQRTPGHALADRHRRNVHRSQRGDARRLHRHRPRDRCGRHQPRAHARGGDVDHGAGRRVRDCVRTRRRRGAPAGDRVPPPDRHPRPRHRSRRRAGGRCVERLGAPRHLALRPRRGHARRPRCRDGGAGRRAAAERPLTGAGRGAVRAPPRAQDPGRRRAPPCRDGRTRARGAIGPAHRCRGAQRRGRPARVGRRFASAGRRRQRAVVAEARSVR